MLVKSDKSNVVLFVTVIVLVPLPIVMLPELPLPITIASPAVDISTGASPPNTTPLALVTTSPPPAPLVLCNFAPVELTVRL